MKVDRSLRKALFIGLACSALALAVRLPLDALLGSSLPYAFALGGVALGIFIGGWQAGAASAIASAVWVNYVYVIPRYEFEDLINVPLVASLLSYAAIATVLVCFGARESRSLARLTRAKEDLQRALDAAERANEAWRRADQQKDDFISVLSHELRNPLGAIFNATLVIRERSRNRDLLPAVELLYRQLQQMRALLDDLLDVARINRGMMSLHRETQDVRLCVQNAIEANMHLVEQAGQELEVTLPDEAVMLEVDGARITQIVSNLVNNATKYAGRGTHIDVRLDRHPDGASITVRDDGAGIDGDLLADLFQQYSGTGARGSVECRHRAIQGLGLGLWISQQLALLHGGKITAVSEGAGTGAEFTVRIPCDAPRPQ